MDLIEVEKLLVKYENAETTLREEAILRTYIQQLKNICFIFSGRGVLTHHRVCGFRSFFP